MEDQQVSTLVPVPTKEGYFCDEDGNIYSNRRGNTIRKLKPYEQYGRSKKQPYLRVSLDGYLPMAHRVVLAAKIGRWLEPDEYTNHINGIAVDNRFENLEVVTHKENMEHASRNKLLAHGDAWYIARGMEPR